MLWRAEDPVTAWLLLLAVLLFLVVFPWLAGRYRLQRRALAEAGWARAARLEEEQRGVAERAALRERARIAAEMHDALGHELSLLALRAGTLQVAADLPERHREAAAGLRAATADAVDRLHEIVGVLRAEEAEPGRRRTIRPPSPTPRPRTTFSAARWPRGSRYGSRPGPSGPTRTRRCATGWCGKHSPTPRATRRAPK